MTNYRKDLAIVIVTYNSLDYIIDCIKSIHHTCDIPSDKIEIIVVDNSSFDVFLKTKELILKFFGSTIQIIHNDKNGGYGQGNNVGIKAATAPYVLVMNPDVILLKPEFKKVLTLFQNNSDLAMIGGKQLGGKNISFWNLPEYDFFLLTAPFSLFLNKLNIFLSKFFYLSGALLYIDKSKFEEIGLFDDKFFLYCEESDIQKRFKKYNYTVRFEKDIIYNHLVDDRDDVSEKSFNFLMNSTKLYMKKNNLNFTAFLKRKILAYKLMFLIYNVLSKKDQANKTEMYLERFKNLYVKELK